MKGSCPNYFVRHNPGNPTAKAWEVVRDNGDGEQAIPVAQFASKRDAMERRDAIRERAQARGRFLAQSVPQEPKA